MLLPRDLVEINGANEKGGSAAAFASSVSCIQMRICLVALDRQQMNLRLISIN